jgi:hypothetical protein
MPGRLVSLLQQCEPPHQGCEHAQAAVVLCMSWRLCAALDKAGVTTAARSQLPRSMSVINVRARGIDGKLLGYLLCCESVYLLLNKLPHIGEPLRQAIHTCSSMPCTIQGLHTLLQLIPSRRADCTRRPSAASMSIHPVLMWQPVSSRLRPATTPPKFTG